MAPAFLRFIVLAANTWSPAGVFVYLAPYGTLAGHPHADISGAGLRREARRLAVMYVDMTMPVKIAMMSPG